MEIYETNTESRIEIFNKGSEDFITRCGSMKVEVIKFTESSIQIAGEERDVKMAQLKIENVNLVS